MKYKKTHYGINQVPGVKTPCPNHFHYCYPDYVDAGVPFPEGPLHEDGDECPDCGATSMPGGVVTKAFKAEYERRLAEGICLTSRGGKFECSRKVPAKTLAGGSCICPRCEDAELREEARCEALASARYEEDYR